MKKTSKKATAKRVPALPKPAELQSEYRFDSRQAQPNRFSRKVDPRIILLDPDVARVFTSPEAVNQILRALIQAMPAPPRN